MAGYSRACSRADSSILLVAQWAAALSMVPASAPSCWAQGVTAASYNEYAIWVSPSGGILGRDHRGSPVRLPTALSLNWRPHQSEHYSRGSPSEIGSGKVLE